jgi:hypothetical protein
MARIISSQVSKSFVNLHFDTVEHAVKAARWLSETTNIYTYFHHPHQKTTSGESVGSIGGGDFQPESLVSKTIHVQWLDRDLLGLVKYFGARPGVTRIGK